MAAIRAPRSLAQQARVVLVDLALDAPALSIIAVEPSAPGIAELVAGTHRSARSSRANRYSRVHLIMAGPRAVRRRAIMARQRLSITIEALGRSYRSRRRRCRNGGEVALEPLAVLDAARGAGRTELDSPATAIGARTTAGRAGFPM